MKCLNEEWLIGKSIKTVCSVRAHEGNYSDPRFFQVLIGDPKRNIFLNQSKLDYKLLIFSVEF